MQPIKVFVMPDRKKTILFVIFVLITLAGTLQRAPLIESPPSPTPSRLGDFSFTLLSVLLAVPYQILLMGLGLVGGVPLYRFTWLVIAGNVVYLYFLSCLLITGFNRYRHRFSKWHWIAVIGLPFVLIVLYLIFLSIPSVFIDDLLNFLGVAMIMSLYLHLLFCLGFFVRDVTTRIRR
jgi:hypothetical protein